VHITGVIVPEVPVTVTVYIPAMVPALLVPLPLLPPPQLTMPQVRHVSKTSIPSIARQLRRRAGMPKSNKHARAAPPVAYQGIPTRLV
jgi:hypothetical protein